MKVKNETYCLKMDNPNSTRLLSLDEEYRKYNPDISPSELKVRFHDRSKNFLIEFKQSTFSFLHDFSANELRCIADKLDELSEEVK